MQPNHYDLLGQVQDEPRAPNRMTRETPQSRLPSGVAPTRSEDSWIEVSSQPSSSSLSSAATNDDIITTGLRVQQNESSHYRRSRRRRLQHLAAVATAQVDYSSREPSSSQDEYEESESESDRVLSSSNEDIGQRTHVDSYLPQPSAPDASPSSDEDDSSTALGMRISSSPFIPQPNVFSHPPASQHPSWTRPTEARRSQPLSEVSTSSRRTAIRRSSQASAHSARRPSNQQHSPYNLISPSHHADHDAALRASLSTLLSCAAAARGLPKSDPQPSPSGPSRAQPASFRLVSESVAMGEEAREDDPPSETEISVSPHSQRPKQYQQSPPPYSPRGISSTRAKRRSSTSKDRGGHSSTKKSRRTGNAESSSAVMTWVISAGVVVLFSAISFSAGYVLGREVGKLEANTGVGTVLGDNSLTAGKASAACGQEAVRGGLRRFRWSPGSAGSGVIA
ncbi:hypothetical protein ARAM_002884 [Aspergillus rambellii]|uniref:Uncharacterized protein n=1 Tax=Aspergillus rambellii TaxID=308745 RepID=A0A0F8UQH8_9EURO|nr:hypothetical protein ARAM_002884 [Aspergillus rambellii]